MRNTELSIKGFPFISQDGDATVCAESVMWMMMRYFSNRYSLYKERYPFEITRMTEHHADGSRVYPSGGLSVWQISESLRHAGFSTLIYTCNTEKLEGEIETDFDQQREGFHHQLSTYIESGIPVIISVPNHVLIGMGHKHVLPLSLNKPITFTSTFFSSYIIHDDNIPAYQELQKSHNITEPWSTSDYHFDQIDSFIVPLAEKIFLRVEDFQKVVMTLIKGDEFGIENHSKSLKSEKLVMRVFLTSCRSFKKKLPDREEMGNPIVAHLYSEIPLPHFIWICEISILDEYKNEKILGEIIWDATRNAYEPHGFIAIHYPEVLIFDSGAPFNRAQELNKIDLTGSRPYIIYKNNLQEY